MQPGSSSFEEQLREHGYLVFTNVGTSMMPLLRQNRDLMVIRALPESCACEGAAAAEGGAADGLRSQGPMRAARYDAVLYRAGERYILHRVLHAHPETRTYTICGDHCVRCERNVPECALLGVLTEIRRMDSVAAGDAARSHGMLRAGTDASGLPVDMHWRVRGERKPPLGYRLYVHAWCDLFYGRIAMLQARRVCGAVKRRVLRVARAKAAQA